MADISKVERTKRRREEMVKVLEEAGRPLRSRDIYMRLPHKLRLSESTVSIGSTAELCEEFVSAGKNDDDVHLWELAEDE